MGYDRAVDEAHVNRGPQRAGARELTDHKTLREPGNRQARHLARIHARTRHRAAGSDKHHFPSLVALEDTEAQLG